MRFLVILLCALLLCSPAAYAGDDSSMIPKEWLQKPFSAAEAEAAYPGITDDRVKRFPDAAKPFGFKNADACIKNAAQALDSLLRGTP